MHKFKLITPPTVEPFDLTEAKSHLRVTSTLEDALITSWITATRRMIERYLNRALITQEYELYLDTWPCTEIKLPFGSLQSVESVKVFIIDGTESTLVESDYYWVDDVSEPAMVIRKYNAVWPVPQYARPNAIKITFTCGYGDAGSDVPEDIISAIKIRLTDLHENRGSVAVGQAVLVNKIPNYMEDLIHSYKLYEF